MKLVSIIGLFSLIVLTLTNPNIVPKSRSGKLELDGKIIHGSIAKPGDHPWMVYIKYFKRGLCGGFLVDRQHVITAAHCVVDYHGPREPSNFEVYVGAYNLDGLDAPYEVDKIQYPPHYKPSEYDYDIAVLRLRSNVTYSSKVSPICLAGEELKPHENLTVAGFGQTGPHVISPSSSILLEVGVEYIPHDECEQKLQKYVPKTHICAINMTTGGDSCRGDSGSALIYRKNGRKIAVGVVSFGRECGSKHLPGAYTEVKLFREQLSEWAPGSKWCNF